MRVRLTFAVFMIAFSVSIFSQNFTRMGTIPVPAIENCGLGEMIVGVDFDGDGKSEIYAVNNMFDLGGNELVPRVYKFEFNGTTWDEVWSATMNIPLQNTWPALTWGDWDDDGKPEIIWGPVNNLNATTNPNPARIIVFEYPGDGSDNMGVDNFGSFLPNATWTIVNTDMYNLRPFRWMLRDIDGDGDLELVFVSRVAGERFGVVGVSDIPDLGGQSETWTLKGSGLNQTIDASTIYDMSVIGTTLYIIHSNGNITPVTYSSGNYTAQTALTNLVPGGSWKSARTVDIDGDGSLEVVVGGWLTGTDNKVWVLKETSPGVLTSTQIADFSSLIGAGRINGGDHGDIDGDGKIDFVFGTRGATPTNAIVRLKYLGGDVTNPANYSSEIVDSEYPISIAQGRWDVVKLGDINGNGKLEVMYTNGIDGMVPIIYVEYTGATSVENEQIPNSFYVNQNFPNPFNPSTSISFGLTNEALVSIKVYNLLGELVAVVMENELRQSGNHQVMFHSNDLPSGNYIYTVQAGENIISKKMTLLK